MHEASFEKMRAFRNAYLAPRRDPINVLDVGAGGEHPAQSYRSLFPSPDFAYVGLDLAPSANTDLVPADPFSWVELPDESVDVVISGQTLEHDPFFWITAAEIARVLVPGGLVTVIAPSTGYVHRCPLDCWRFYPDSWAAICAYVGLHVEESYTESSAGRRVLHGLDEWHDSMLVARKPELSSETSRDYYERLAVITSTRVPIPATGGGSGPAATAYEAAHGLGSWDWARRRLEFLGIRPMSSPRMPRRYRTRYWSRLRRTSRSRGEERLPWPPRDGAPPA